MFTTSCGERKVHLEDEQFNLVAWGGIEPPTQGFSVQGTVASGCSLSPRSVTGFWFLALVGGVSSEPATELFGVGWRHGDRKVEWNQRHGDRYADPGRPDGEPMAGWWVVCRKRVGLPHRVTYSPRARLRYQFRPNIHGTMQDALNSYNLISHSKENHVAAKCTATQSLGEFGTRNIGHGCFDNFLTLTPQALNEIQGVSRTVQSDVVADGLQVRLCKRGEFKPHQPLPGTCAPDDQIRCQRLHPHHWPRPRQSPHEAPATSRP